MHKEFWDQFPKPIIGLAPMEGYSDSAFRQLCKIINPALITYTEFTSADGLNYGAQRIISKLAYDPSEQPIIAQIFGKNTESFINAAKWCEDQGFAGIDINMGCPAKKVVKSEHGVALRRNLPLAFKLIEALAQSTRLPISVKTRLGWSDASDLLDFCRGAQAAGANMLAIHGRTYKEPYNVPAQFESIYELKSQISIPVLINGGITDISDGVTKVKHLDGFLIGQAAFGNPWVFAHSTPSFLDRIPFIIRHTELMIETKGEKHGILEMRKHLLHYVKGFPGAKEYRSALCHVQSLTDVRIIMDQIRQLNLE